MVEKARDGGLPVGLEAFAHLGHILLLPHALERALAWLGLAPR